MGYRDVMRASAAAPFRSERAVASAELDAPDGPSINNLAPSAPFSTERAVASAELDIVAPDGPSLDDLQAALVAGRHRPEILYRDEIRAHVLSAERAAAAAELEIVAPDGPSLNDLQAALIAGRHRPELTPRGHDRAATAGRARTEIAPQDHEIRAHGLGDHQAAYGFNAELASECAALTAVTTAVVAPVGSKSAARRMKSRMKPPHGAQSHTTSQTSSTAGLPPAQRSQMGSTVRKRGLSIADVNRRASNMEPGSDKATKETAVGKAKQKRKAPPKAAPVSAGGGTQYVGADVPNEAGARQGRELWKRVGSMSPEDTEEALLRESERLRTELRDLEELFGRGGTRRPTHSDHAAVGVQCGRPATASLRKLDDGQSDSIAMQHRRRKDEDASAAFGKWDSSPFIFDHGAPVLPTAASTVPRHTPVANPVARIRKPSHQAMIEQMMISASTQLSTYSEDYRGSLP